MASSHPRPVFTLDGPELPQMSFAHWSGFGGIPAQPTQPSPDSTPRLGSAWKPCDLSSAPCDVPSPAQVALAAFEASRYIRKRSLTLDSSFTSSSSSSLESGSGGEYDDYLTPATSVASISPCHSPIDLGPDSSYWRDEQASRVQADISFGLERSLSGASLTSSCASSETCTATPAEPMIRSASCSEQPSGLKSRPLLARCLTAPHLGMSMVRSISQPVATQAAHDAALRDVKAGVERIEQNKRVMNTSKDEMRLETPTPANLPWPYNVNRRFTPDNALYASQLHPQANTGRRGSRPTLSRAVTFDSSLLQAEG